MLAIDASNGKQLYISINLKSLEPITNADPNDIILTIKMPYKIWSDSANSRKGGYKNSNFVKFKNLPKVTGIITNDTLQIRGARGDWRGIKRDTSSELSSFPGMREFNITAAMLDVDGNGTANKDITLSAFVLFNSVDDGLGGYKWNPILEPDWNNHGYDTIYIKNLDVQVTYHGNLDVAIDWIRLETPRAKEIYEGKYDIDVYEYAVEILDEFAGETLRNPNAFRFYAADEIKPHQYGLNRYYNLLLDTLANSEIGISANDAPYYSHATGFQEFWNGDNLSFSSKYTSPFIEYAIIKDSTFYKHDTSIVNGIQTINSYYTKETRQAPEGLNYGFGHLGRYKRVFVDTIGVISEGIERTFPDSLNSNYELYMQTSSIYNSIPLPESIWPFDSLYDESVIGREPYYLSSPQYATEYRLYQFYKKHPFMIFGGEPWWANLWVQSEDWSHNNNLGVGTLNDLAKRPKTGEEITLMTFNPIILGTKGLIYWKKTTSGGNLGVATANLSPYYLSNLPNSEPLIYSDFLGGDFKRFSDPNLYVNQIDTSKLRLDYFGHSGKRVYIGLKSARAQMYKLHKWINIVEDELMDLRLQAWHSKGFKEWEDWNKYDSYKYWKDSPLRRIINVDSIRTRKLFEPKSNFIHNNNPGYESRDSSFFEITLLQDKRDSPKDLYNRKKSVYLGIQNRRLDPLIFRDSIDVNPVNNFGELMFFSSAEMDSNVRFGGKDLWGVQQNGDWWQDQWWKRLGARELRIPINIPVYGNGTYIIAEELGLDTLNSIGWWYADSLYHKVDTLLLGGDNLFSKLLPGQGKIIKLSYVPYFFNDPTKDSDTTNDHCYFCDIFNDPDMFELSVVEGAETGSNCCYDISFTYNGDCEFEDIPFRLLFTKDSVTSFTQDIIELNNPFEIQDSLDLRYKYKDTVMSLNNASGTIELGTFCLADTATGYTISLLAGKDKDYKFIGCDREMSFKVSCDLVDKEIKDCCENLVVTDTMFTIGSDPNVSQYCTKLKVDNGFDSDCIYGVTLGNGEYKRTLDSIKSSPIDFTSGSGKEYLLCTELLNCSPTNPPSTQVTMVKMQFLGKDGTVICEVEVPIWLPCIYTSLDDLDLTSPALKSSKPKEKPDSKTYESETFKVTVWPNPTSGELNVEIDSKVDTEVDINFISNIGASISNENDVTINKGVNEKIYNLKPYSSGVYYLQINGKDGNIVLPIMLNK